MIFMRKKWLVKTTNQKNDFAELFDDLQNTILKNRDIKKKAEVEAIVKPNYELHLHDPFLMKDMDLAVSRVLKAIENKEKILIFGDYDADGVPASVILAEFFDQINYENYSVYIPDRHTEQYGMSEKVIDKFKKDQVELIITVDCGISNFKEVKKANKLGIDVIVTDHHLPPAKLPQAVAVVDPKRADCTYPYSYLAGAGVAFKLVQGLIARGDFKTINPGWEKWLLDLVAIATVSDMVPMTGENKVLVKFGLVVLRVTRRTGLLELFRVMRMKQQHIVEDDIGFMIGPRINSAGRMSHAMEAFKLLTTKDENEAREIVKHLEDKNKERKNLVAEILQVVSDKYLDKELPAVVVVGDADWGLGVLGLAASRIAEKYDRPVFVWAKNGSGEIKGSCRSDGRVNVVELMTEVDKVKTKKAGGGDRDNQKEEKFFSDFGGHDFAGGFSLMEKKLKKLQARLVSAYKKAKKSVVAEEELADKKIALSDVNWQTVREIDELAPYGIDFPRPVFWFEGATIVSAKSFGKVGGHVEVVFKTTSGTPLPAIAFFACDGDLVPDQGHIWPGVTLAPGRVVDVLASVEKSTFKYKPEIRLRIVDLKVR